MHRKHILMGLSLCAGMAVASDVSASNDDKIYMANFCRVASGSATYNQSGGVSNPSKTVEANLDCPIVRDSSESSIDFITILIQDLNLADQADIRCRVRVRKADGTTASTGLYITPNDGYTGVGLFEQIVMFADAPGTVRYDPGDTAGLLLRCTLPRASATGASSMYMYTVREY